MIALIVAAIGLVLYGLGDRIHAKVPEIGRLLFFAGVLVWLFEGTPTRF